MHIWAKLGQENLLRMVRCLRWHCPPDTGFEFQALAVCVRARYLSVTEAPHNTDFHTWMGKKHFLFLSNRRDREPNPGVKGSGANHCPRAPAHRTLYWPTSEWHCAYIPGWSMGLSPLNDEWFCSHNSSTLASYPARNTTLLWRWINVIEWRWYNVATMSCA